MCKLIVVALLLSIALPLPIHTNALRPDYRSFSGRSNSLEAISLGQARSEFRRLQQPRAAPLNRTLVEPRIISNRFGELPKRLSSTGINLLHPFFAEIVAHDLVSTLRTTPPVQLSVPKCDPYYDPPSELGGQCSGNATMWFDRPAALTSNNSSHPQAKVFTNLRNSWLDLSWLYGLSDEDNQAIRLGSGGKIAIRYFENPKKLVYDQTLWVKGGETTSVNLNPSLHSFFNLFVRNHNYWAEKYSNILRNEGRIINDEIIFQEARAMNIAEYQSIVVRQYLPATVGVPLPPYVNAEGEKAYNSTLNPGIDLVFASAAFRYAHPEIMGFLPRIGPDLKEIQEGGIPLRSSFFNPLKHYIPDGDYGVYVVPENSSSSGEPTLAGPAVVSLFRGLSHNRAGAVEPTLIEDMRNFVFSALPTKPGIDLLSLGIQICRDQELGTYNDVRGSLGLPPVSLWSQVTSHPPIQRALASLYETIDDCDPWICLLAEDPVGSAAVGHVTGLVILDQFTRIRNADRFWFENLDFFSAEEIQSIYAVTVGSLVARNYPIQVDGNATGTYLPITAQFPKNSFFLPDRQLQNYQSDARDSKVFFPDPPFAVDGFVDVGPVYRVSWKFNRDNSTITFLLQGRFFGWLGMGLEPEPNTMRGADIVLCRLLNPTNTSSTAHECRDCYALDVGPPTLDTDLGGTNDIQYSQVFLDQNFQTFMFVKPVETKDKWDKRILKNTDQKVIFGFNPSTYDLLYHGPLRSSGLSLKFILDQTSAIGVLDKATSVVIGLFSSFGILLSMAMMGFVAARPKFFHYQETLFCQMILIGTILGYLSSFVNIAGTATPATCLANLWLLMLSYILVVSSLFIKTWRMYRLLDMSTLQVLKITRIDMLRLVGIHLIAESALLVAWTVVDPPVPNSSANIASGNVGCSQRNDLWWFISMAMKLAYLGVGTFLSVKNRHHAPIFADSKEVGIATYVLFITMFIVGTIGIALRQFSYVVLIVKSLGVVVPYIVVAFVLFSGTCFAIISGKDPLSIYASSSQAGKPSEFRSDFTLSEASDARGGHRMQSEFSLALTNDETLFTPRSFYQPSVAFSQRTQAELDSGRSAKSDAAGRRKKRTPTKRRKNTSTSSYSTSSLSVSEAQQPDVKGRTSKSSSSSEDDDSKSDSVAPSLASEEKYVVRSRSLGSSVETPSEAQKTDRHASTAPANPDPGMHANRYTESSGSNSDSESDSPGPQSSARSCSAISDTTSLPV